MLFRLFLGGDTGGSLNALYFSFVDDDGVVGLSFERFIFDNLDLIFSENSFATE